MNYGVHWKQAQFDAAKKAALAALACWLVAGLFLEEILAAAAVGLLGFFPALAILLYYPKMKKRHYAGIVEAGLPFSMMEIAVELNLGVPFMQAIRHASLGRGHCAKEFKAVEKEVREQGASVQEALRHFAERVESSAVKRAVTQLSAAFEQGTENRPGDPVKRIAAEILTRQRLESKMFSGKMVMGSLLFIGISAIVPALFQSFSIVGSVILRLSFTATELFLIITVGFPLLDLAVLLYLRSRTPVFLRVQ